MVQAPPQREVHLASLFRRALAFGVGLGALGIGCPRPATLTPDAGALPVDWVGRACNVDGECGPLRCDTIRRRCICLSDDSCKGEDPEAPVRYCSNYTGLCVTEVFGCVDDSVCPSGQYCDRALRACRPLKGFCERCNADSECGGEKDNCRLDLTVGQKFCSRACAQTAECPRGSSCQLLEGQLQCWPAGKSLTSSEPASCVSFRGCTPDTLAPCTVQADCASLEEQRCDTARGRCVAAVAYCPFGMVCDPRGKICVAECAVDADCGDPTLRCRNRVCEAVGECTSDAQCLPSEICSVSPGQTSGRCVAFCTKDQDCPLGALCSRGTDGKYRCVPGCARNGDCPIDQRCSAASSTCEGPVVGSGRTCQVTAACQPCELCDPIRFECFSAKAGLYCSQCSPAVGCAGGACVQFADGGLTYCAPYCGPGRECPQGFVCLALAVDAGSLFGCVPANRQCRDKCQ